MLVCYTHSVPLYPQEMLQFILMPLNSHPLRPLFLIAYLHSFQWLSLWKWQGELIFWYKHQCSYATHFPSVFFIRNLVSHSLLPHFSHILYKVVFLWIYLFVAYNIFCSSVPFFSWPTTAWGFHMCLVYSLIVETVELMGLCFRWCNC